MTILIIIPMLIVLFSLLLFLGHVVKSYQLQIRQSNDNDLIKRFGLKRFNKLFNKTAPKQYFKPYW